MERGVPPIISDAPGADLIVENYKSGLIVKRNVQDIAEAICYLLGNESVRIEMGKEARKRVRTNFDEGSRSETLYDLYMRKVWMYHIGD